MNEDNVTIDTIIPVYNGSNFVIRAIESVINQTIPPSKIIVVNDGSKDNTEDLVLAYKKKSSFPIEYIKKTNEGPSSARNTGILKSTANFLAFLDADDKWLPSKLEKQIEILKNSEYRNLGLIYCSYEEINENDDMIYLQPTMIPTLRGNVFEKLLWGNFISSGSSGVLIRRECFRTVGLFDQNLRGSEDWDMWLRISEKYDIDFTEKILVCLRSHSYHSQSNGKLMYENKIYFYNKWIKKFQTDGRVKFILKMRTLKLIKEATEHFPFIDFIFMHPRLKRGIKKMLWKKQQ